MGKNRNIQIIGKLIGGMAAHKILEKYTNKKESLNHLRAEVDNYKDNVSYYIKGHNWNSDNKNRIKEEAKKRIKIELKEPHFNDVSIPAGEIEIFLNQIIKEFFKD